MVLFNWEENSISTIDNRALMNNPFGNNYIPEDGEERDITEEIEQYLQDRIGLRDQMIYAYTVLNDALLHNMVHPSYEYGKDGYVFMKSDRNRKFGDFELAYVDMLEKINTYCSERSIPFIFVLNPSKISILRNELKDGINYNNEWLETFFDELDKRGIKYVDNSEILQQKINEGEMVFNKKYNAGHWNDLGAFFGVNNILKGMQESYPQLHINSKEEFLINEVLNTSLPVSEFPIHEYEPVFELKDEVENRSDLYRDELSMHPDFPTFGYFVNENRKSEENPKTLVFQGSYMNGMGYKFMMNSLNEYIYVHAYQNAINFDYYYNIFKPDFVILENAEATLSGSFFFQEGMEKMELPPSLKAFEAYVVEEDELKKDSINIEEEKQLANITVKNLGDDVEYAYLIIGDEEFSMAKADNTYRVTVEKTKINKGEINVITICNGIKKIYKLIA